MTSGYLHLPIRSEAQALRDQDRRDSARSGGRPNPDREWAHYHLNAAAVHLRLAMADLEEATKRLPIGEGMEDQISAVKDAESDVQTKIERLT